MEAVWQKLTCSTCGGQLEEKNGKLVCKYCRSVYHAIEKISEAEVIALNNATTDRNRMLFDDAQEKYDLLLKDYPDNAEANWGAFLCAYGIIYEKDYNDEYKPTCHRLNECPVKKSPYYAKLTDENKKRADEIEELRLKILAEVKKIQPYDVFICYKQNEDKASENAPKIPTRESKWARDIYEMLSRDLGLKVFFAEKSLSGTNVDYEPHIYAALRSAKLMIVLASSIEHVNAVWVKNEWKRYAKYIREGENKTLRVVYDGVEPYELPKELQNKQAICHDDINWNESLANSVRELFNAAPSLETREIKTKEYTKKERGHGAVVKTTLETFVPTVIPPTENGQLDNAEDLLRLKKFTFAKMTLQTVLAANRASKRAWLDMFLCENGYTDVGAFTSAANTIKDFKSFENALASAQKESEKEELIDLFIARIQGTPTLNLYQEYIRLPHTTPSQDEKALQAVYTQSVNTCDTALFDCLIESVADTDRFIDWNFSFGKQVYLKKGAKVAEKYFNAVLQYDEGHQETLLYKYIAKLGVKDENAFVQACLKLKDYGEIEKIYEYGYFTRLSKLLLDGSLVAIKAGNVANAVRLIDFLLSIIPKGENSRYLNSLDLVVDALFSAKAYAHLNKYLNSVLVLSPDNHEAYFQRVMVKYKVNNAYSLIKVMDKLMEEQDFSNAMNTYAKLYPTQKNLYMQLYTQYDYISGLLKEHKITADEFAQDWILELPLQEIVENNLQEKFLERAKICSKDKMVDGFSTISLLPALILMAVGLLLIFKPSILLKVIPFTPLLIIFIALIILCIVLAIVTNVQKITDEAKNRTAFRGAAIVVAAIISIPLFCFGSCDRMYYIRDTEDIDVIGLFSSNERFTYILELESAEDVELIEPLLEEVNENDSVYYWKKRDIKIVLKNDIDMQGKGVPCVYLHNTNIEFNGNGYTLSNIYSNNGYFLASNYNDDIKMYDFTIKDSTFIFKDYHEGEIPSIVRNGYCLYENVKVIVNDKEYNATSAGGKLE